MADPIEKIIKALRYLGSFKSILGQGALGVATFLRDKNIPNGIRIKPTIITAGSRIYITRPMYVELSKKIEVIANRNTIIKKLTSAIVAPIREIQLCDESGILIFIFSSPPKLI
jgi:hypothetical protein